jgi:PAS domain S-box-containing protein
MAIKMEQLPATSTNPALNVAKDGTVLYSNEAGNLLLNEWGVAAGDKLPSDIGDLVIRVLSLNSPEKMEIKVGNRVYLIVLHPIPEELYVNISGFDITDLKQAEEKTKLEEDRFAKIERLAEVGYWEWDVIKDDFIWSEQMYKIYRRNPNLKPPRYSEHHLYFTPESWARLERESKRTLEYEEPSELELEHIREDGSHGWQIARAEAVFDKVGHVIKLWGSVRDITEQKQAEEEVKNASNMLQLIMNNIPQAIFWKDCNSRYLGCNKVFAEDAGFQSPENIVGKTDYDLPWALEQTEWYHKCDRRVMKNDTPEYHIYETQTTAEGKLTWLDTNKIPLHDSKGNVIGILGTYEDITERKKAEEALRLLNLYNRSLIETCLDPLVTIGHDGKIMDVNRATEAVTGYTRNELIGNDFSDYFTEPEKARAGYQQVFTEGKVRDYPLEIQHKDGHVTPVLYNASVYNDESGKVIGVFAAARDISERKKAEDALQESKAKLEAALESMTDAVFMSDTQGNLINFNEAFATFHKFKSKGDCYKTLSEYPDYIDVYFADGTLAPLVMWAIPRALRGETVTDAEYILRRKDTGETWTASYNFAPIRDKDGEIVGSVVIGRDITERKQAEKALMESESFLKFAQVSAGAGV